MMQAAFRLHRSNWLRRNGSLPLPAPGPSSRHVRPKLQAAMWRCRCHGRGVLETRQSTSNARIMARPCSALNQWSSEHFCHLTHPETLSESKRTWQIPTFQNIRVAVQNRPEESCSSTACQSLQPTYLNAQCSVHCSAVPLQGIAHLPTRSALVPRKAVGSRQPSRCLGCTCICHLSITRLELRRSYMNSVHTDPITVPALATRYDNGPSDAGSLAD